jgi:transposase
MARKLDDLGQELAEQIEQAWARRDLADWQRKRLLVVRLIAQHRLDAKGIAEVAGVSRASVFNYRDKLAAGGVEGLLSRDWAGARKPAVRGPVAEEFGQALEQGKFRQAKDAQKWIAKRTRRRLTVSGAWKVLRRLGGKLKAPRKSHAKKDQAKSDAFRAGLAEGLAAVVGTDVRRVRVWVLDEHRYGLLPVIRRVWGKRGVRVHAPYATKYKWGYLHEAMEVDGDNAAELLFTPAIDRDTHALFLRQIAQSDPDALHVIIQDQAGFHLPTNDPRLPPNLRLLPLPPYCPELNPVERLGGLIKAQVCNRLYPTLARLERHIEAVAKACLQPAKVASLIHDWLLDQVNDGVPA